MNHRMVCDPSRVAETGRRGRGRSAPAAASPRVSDGPTGAGLRADAGRRCARGALETLTAAEAETLGAIAARLIPTDSSGPGATEARAAQYIDRALGGALASFRETYRDGLAALDRHAQSTKGNPFARLSATDQDAVLRDLEGDAATGFPGGASAFFSRGSRPHHPGHFLRSVLRRQRRTSPGGT